MTTELQTLALEIAHEIAESDIECFCLWIVDDDSDISARWYNLDEYDRSNDGETTMITRAERFLDLAGRLERRADNPRIVRIRAGERAHG